MKIRNVFFALIVTLTFGCSTFKTIFTSQGQWYSHAQDMASKGKNFQASLDLLEALTIEPTYEEAIDLIQKTWAPGQAEFQQRKNRLEDSTKEDRWDSLYADYAKAVRMREIISKLPVIVDTKTGTELSLAVDDYSKELKNAGRNAAGYHIGLAQKLIDEDLGPRSCRKGLAELELAQSYDRNYPDIGTLLRQATLLAEQKVAIFPFFYGGWFPGGQLSGALGSEISRNLLNSRKLPKYTSIFASDRLATLSGGSFARMGFLKVEEAVAMAKAAKQNMIVQGQITKAIYTEPVTSITQIDREKNVDTTDPVTKLPTTKTLKAKVTYVTKSSDLTLGCSYTLTEIATMSDVKSGSQEVTEKSSVTWTSYTGDQGALTAQDLVDIGTKQELSSAQTLTNLAISDIAVKISEELVEALR